MAKTKRIHSNRSYRTSHTTGRFWKNMETPKKRRHFTKEEIAVGLRPLGIFNLQGSEKGLTIDGRDSVEENWLYTPVQ